MVLPGDGQFFLGKSLGSPWEVPGEVLWWRPYLEGIAWWGYFLGGFGLWIFLSLGALWGGGTSLGDLDCGSSSLSRALCGGGTSLGDLARGSSSLSRALFGCGTGDRALQKTFTKWGMKFTSVGDEVHVGGGLAEDLHVVGDEEQVAGLDGIGLETGHR